MNNTRTNEYPVYYKVILSSKQISKERRKQMNVEIEIQEKDEKQADRLKAVAEAMAAKCKENKEDNKDE